MISTQTLQSALCCCQCLAGPSLFHQVVNSNNLLLNAALTLGSIAQALSLGPQAGKPQFAGKSRQRRLCRTQRLGQVTSLKDLSYLPNQVFNLCLAFFFRLSISQCFLQ